MQQDSVQLANFGRKLVSYKDSLPLYNIDQLRIINPRVLKESGKEFHPILQFTGKSGDEVSGTVFELTESEISAADDYEVDEYQRVKATLKSGRSCWVYAVASMRKSKV